MKIKTTKKIKDQENLYGKTDGDRKTELKDKEGNSYPDVTRFGREKKLNKKNNKSPQIGNREIETKKEGRRTQFQRIMIVTTKVYTRPRINRKGIQLPNKKHTTSNGKY